MDEELLEELSEMIDNGSSMIEVFEYIEDNTDEDPTAYIFALMQEGAVSKVLTSFCLKKRKFNSREAAQAVATHVYKTVGLKLNVYKCHVCGGWHLTHNGKRDKTRGH